VAVLLHPTTTTFMSPAVWAAGKLTGTDAVAVCGVAEATWLKAMGTAVM
jgi:hypothetical protein